MRRVKTKSIIWYYFKHFLVFFGIFTLLEIILGGFIFFTHMSNPDVRNQLYSHWSSILMGIQDLVWFIYLAIINYRAGDKYGNRAFSGVWIWLAGYLVFFSYDMLNFSMFELMIIKTLLWTLAIPMIAIGSYKRKTDIERFNASHNLPGRDKKYR
jgi:hypothetical protein